MTRFQYGAFIGWILLAAADGLLVSGNLFAGEPPPSKSQIDWPKLVGYSRIKAPVVLLGETPQTYYQKATYDWMGGRFEQLEITLARDPTFKDKYSAEVLTKEKNPPKELRINDKKAWQWEFPRASRTEVARRLVVVLDVDKAIIVEQKGDGANLQDVAKRFDFAKVQKALANPPIK